MRSLKCFLMNRWNISTRTIDSKPLRRCKLCLIGSKIPLNCLFMIAYRRLWSRCFCICFFAGWEPIHPPSAAVFAAGSRLQITAADAQRRTVSSSSSTAGPADCRGWRSLWTMRTANSTVTRPLWCSWRFAWRRVSDFESFKVFFPKIRSEQCTELITRNSF